jgi:hypothetical protein
MGLFANDRDRESGDKPCERALDSDGQVLPCEQKQRTNYLSPGMLVLYVIVTVMVILLLTAIS